MDEPSDFCGTVTADYLTFSSAHTGALTCSGANAQAATGWGVYSIGGNTIIAPSVSAAMQAVPPRRLGWEGHGAKPKDDPESNHFDTAIKRLEQAVERMHREMAGAKVANAISAIHNQQPRDGRPSQYMPEVA